MARWITKGLLVFSLILVSVPSAWGQDDIHTPWDGLLARHLVQADDGINRFDYEALRSDDADRAALEAYIHALERAQPSMMSEAEAFAFWANLYNALTVKLIVDEAPERSIRQIRPYLFSIGPWGVDWVTVEGEALSLDNIEHDIMREEFQAPLVHYAVNCASIGCPNLKSTAWRAATLDADLQAAARAYINHPRGVTVTEDGLIISRIYKWFREDFGDSEEGVIAHLLEHASPDLATLIRENPRIRGHEYDWSLNRP